jgi:hypothetical protein
MTDFNSPVGTTFATKTSSGPMGTSTSTVSPLGSLSTKTGTNADGSTFTSTASTVSNPTIYETPDGESGLASNYPSGMAYLTPVLGVDTFMQWFRPPWVFLFYCLMELFCCVGYGFILALATYQYPGAFVLFVILRSAIIAGGRYFFVLGWSSWTGATLDLPNLLLFGFDEMIFGRRFVKGGMTVATRFSVLGKILFLGLFQFGGYLIGVAMLATISGNPVLTTDCTVTFADSCNLKPALVGIGASQGEWASFWGNLLILGAYAAAWGLDKKISVWVGLITRRFNSTDNVVASDDQAQSEPEGFAVYNELSNVASGEEVAPPTAEVGSMVVPFEINGDWSSTAKMVAVADFVANAIFSVTNGTFGNFWFWLVTCAFTSNYSGSAAYAWQGFIAGATVFIVQVLIWAIASGSRAYQRRIQRKEHRD